MFPGDVVGLSGGLVYVPYTTKVDLDCQGVAIAMLEGELLRENRAVATATIWSKGLTQER